MTDHASWRWSFASPVPLGVLAMAVVFFGLPDVRFPVVRHGID